MINIDVVPSKKSDEDEGTSPYSEDDDGT